MRNFYRQRLKIRRKNEYFTSIKEISKYDDTLDKSIKDYILERLKEVELNNIAFLICSQIVQDKW